MVENNFKAIAFDVDGTLTAGNSWLTLTESLGGSPARHFQIYDRYRTGVIGYSESRKQLLELWQSTGNATREHIEGAFDSIALDNDAIEVVSELRELGLQILIISGSMDIFVANVARRLAVSDYFYNTSLHFSSTGNLESFDYTLEQADLKVSQLSGYCALRSLNPDQVAVVGDGENDLGMFRYTSRGIQLSPQLPDGQATPDSWMVAHRLAEVLT